jgi:peptidoglycan pentaglycine glycine transferase (the first glycine)
MIIPVTPTSLEWDAFVSMQPRAHVLQQSAWGDLKAAYGWGVERVALREDERIVAGAQLLFRQLPLHLGNMAYLAMGPYVKPEHEAALWAAIDAAARKRRAAFLKWEPGIYDEGERPPDFIRLGFRQSAQTVQPPRTVIIDLTEDDETILARMNQGTRRKIRQSEKNNVSYFEGTREDVATFTAMMQTTGARNEFGVHEPKYYEMAYDLFVMHREAALIVAEHEGDPLAGVMVFAKGKSAWYLYGASADVKRNLMATYGVQWKAIQWAQARGCTEYDLWGIPDEDEATLEAQFEQRSDGLWGVYGFKRGWGGKVVRSAGAWDKVYNPLIYAAYRLALKIRNRGE